jgi:tetratricopeptide (TPR) repeat protein
VSTVRFFGVICLAASLLASTLSAQYSLAREFSVTGELRSHDDIGSNEFLVEVYDLRTNSLIERETVSHGQFQLDHVPAGSFSVRLLAAPGETPLVDEYHEFAPGGAPLVLELPERSANKPASGFVSLRDLQHPIPKKAMREAYQAQQLARANNIPKAIAKLENAIRIDPYYRDAHLNLGVAYTRVGRNADARAEFQKALDLGPPAAPLYVDLAFTSLVLRQYSDAESYARKALELDPANSYAQQALRFASSH